MSGESDISAVSLDDDELPPKANALEDLQKSERSNDFPNATQVPAELDDYMDWALQYVGDWGYFQRCGCAIVAAVNVVCGAQIMAHIFVSLPPQMRHVCLKAATHCSDQILLEMDCSLSAEEYEFVASDSSITSDFGLICDSAFKVPLLGTIFFFGFFLGVTVFGSYSDTRGRRPAYIGALWVIQAGALLAVCSPNYIVYALARLIIGMGDGGLGLVSYVWISEVVGSHSRSFILIAQSAGFALGIVLLSPLACRRTSLQKILHMAPAVGQGQANRPAPQRG